MRKNILAMLTVSMFIVSSSVAMAERLSDDMKILNRSMQSIEKSNNAEELKNSLTLMRSAALKAQEKLPFSLKDAAIDSEEVKEYKIGFKDLIKQIDYAEKLVNEGKIDEAKLITEKFKEIRNVNHKKFR